MSHKTAKTLGGCFILVAIGLATQASAGERRSAAGGCPDGGSTRRARLLVGRMKPLEYDIELTFNNEFASTRGTVEILLELSNPDSRPTMGERFARLLTQVCERDRDSSRTAANNEIVLHAGCRLDILDASLRVSDSLEALAGPGDGAELALKDIQRDPKRQMLVLQFVNDLPGAGHFAKLKLNFEDISMRISPLASGRLEDTLLLAHQTPRYHMTRLSNGNARQLLPCFDEPNLKTIIRLTVNQPHPDATVISNSMPVVANPKQPNERRTGGYKTTHFAASQPMAIGSLVLAVGLFDEPLLGDKPAADELPRVSVIAPKGQRSKAKFALTFAEECFDMMRQVAGFKYPLEEFKLDSSAARSEEAIETALNVALVVARQWFGHTLTPKTWQDLWITEGLAAYTALLLVDSIRPQMQVPHYVRSSLLPRAMLLDAQHHYPAVSHPGDFPVDDPYLSTSPFNFMRLIKGASIMLMMRKNVVPSGQHKSKPFWWHVLDQLIEESELRTASGQQGVDLASLAQAFSYERHFNLETVTNIMRPWVEFSGYPTVSLSYQDSGNKPVVLLKQRPEMRQNVCAGTARPASDGGRIWPLHLHLLSYNPHKVWLANQVHAFTPIWNGKWSPASTSLTINMPIWSHGLEATKIEVDDNRWSLPYYRLECSQDVSCRHQDLYLYHMQ